MKKLLIILAIIIIGLVFYLNTSLYDVDNLIKSNESLKIKLSVLEEQVASLKPIKPDREQSIIEASEKSLEVMLMNSFKLISCRVEISQFNEVDYVVVQSEFADKEYYIEDLITMKSFLLNGYQLNKNQLTMIDETGMPHIKQEKILKQLHLDLNNDNSEEDIKLVVINNEFVYLVVNDTYLFYINISSNLESNSKENSVNIEFDLHIQDSIILIGYHVPILKYGSYAEFKCFMYLNQLREVFNSHVVPGFSNAKLEGSKLTFEDYYGQYEYILNEINNEDPGIRRLFDTEYIIDEDSGCIVVRSLLEADASPEIIQFYRKYQMKGAHLEVVESGFLEELELLFKNSDEIN
jgi:hypothetical protein